MNKVWNYCLRRVGQGWRTQPLDEKAKEPLKRLFSYVFLKNRGARPPTGQAPRPSCEGRTCPLVLCILRKISAQLVATSLRCCCDYLISQARVYSPVQAPARWACAAHSQQISLLSLVNV